MKTEPGISVWLDTLKPIELPRLRRALRAEVCVVGAGMAGLTTAYLLAREGHSVVVLDKDSVGSGETARTSAHLSSVLDRSHAELVKIHGPEAARRAAASHAAAVDRVEAIMAEQHISCDFLRVDGYLFLAPGDTEETLDRELAAAQRTGMVGAERALCAAPPVFLNGPCLRFPRQAQFHPLKYLAGLVRGIRRHGGQIFCARVIGIGPGAPARVETAGPGEVLADSVVVATNTPVCVAHTLHAKQAAYNTYVVAARVPRGTFAPALVWDTATPYHYVRVVPGGNGPGAEDLVIIGGEDHKTGQAADTREPYARLERWALERLPAGSRIAYRWSGQVMESADGLALIGRLSKDQPNLYVVTGDSGNGLTHGTIAGMLLADQIAGRPNPWAELYDPGRVRLGALAAAARQNLNVAAQYAEWVTGGDADAAAEIAPDSGAVLRRGAAKLAVYRDAQGRLHQRSAVCPHAACIVAWNAAEKTWDCPCHGSRFDARGRLLHGPATADLPAAPEAAKEAAT